MDGRAQMQDSLDNARQQAVGGQRDLAALVAERNGFIQNWHNDIGDKLTDALSKLSDARESLAKAQLHRQLVELRAEQDSTVMSVAKVSVGSVLNPGQEFITLVPTNAPLEIEANVSGSDDGYISLGDPVDIKFDTFPYARYGLAHGIVRIVSPTSFSAQDESRNPTGAVPVGQPAAGVQQVWYRSRITLDQIDLHNTPANFHLTPGMPVSADIRVGKQTLLRYMLGKMMPLAEEGMREP
jgi:HlyD family secretion protein